MSGALGGMPLAGCVPRQPQPTFSASPLLRHAQQQPGQQPHRRNLLQTAASSVRVADMSAQMRDVRAQMESNEQLGVLMAGLRGSNINDDDFAGDLQLLPPGIVGQDSSSHRTLR